MTSVLYIDKNPINIPIIQEMFLEFKGRITLHVENEISSSLVFLEKDRQDVILFNQNILNKDDLSELEVFFVKFPEIPLIALSNIYNLSDALKIIKKGVQDYLDINRCNPDILINSILFAIERNKIKITHNNLNNDADKTIVNVKNPEEFVPICTNCKKIRNEDDTWERVEFYINKHYESKFTHGVCPDCLEKLYPNVHQKQKKFKPAIIHKKHKDK